MIGPDQVGWSHHWERSRGAQARRPLDQGVFGADGAACWDSPVPSREVVMHEVWNLLFTAGAAFAGRLAASRGAKRMRWRRVRGKAPRPAGPKGRGGRVVLGETPPAIKVG